MNQAEKIRKLLALSVCPGASETEAATALRQALRLMERLGLTEADLAEGNQLEVKEIGLGYTRLPDWLRELMHGTARIFGLYSITKQGDPVTAFITRAKHEIERFMYVYQVAYRAIEGGKSYRGVGKPEYLRGVVWAYLKKVKEVYIEHEAEVSAGQGLILVPAVHRTEAAKAHYLSLNPDVTIRNLGKPLPGSDAFNLGASDGSKLSVSQGVKGAPVKALGRG